MKPVLSNICKILTDIRTNHIANFVFEWLVPWCIHNMYMNVLSGRRSRQKFFHLKCLIYTVIMYSMMSLNSDYKLTFRYMHML